MKTSSGYHRRLKQAQGSASGKSKTTATASIKLWRIYFVNVMIYGFLLGLLVRLVFIQVVEHEKYMKEGEQQYREGQPQKAPRGLIYDRNGLALALNKPNYLLTIHKDYVRDLKKVSDRLARILKQNGQQLYNRLNNSKRTFIVVARDINDQDAKVLEMSKIPGVNISRTSERMYPFRSNLAPVLGLTDIDGKGLSGIERQLNAHLTGTDGWRILQRDARGRRIMTIESLTQEAVKGSDVTLTIDHNKQVIVEEELNDTVAKYHAKGGSVIVVAPATGEIVALVANPTFDPNDRGGDTWASHRIRGITDMFEPGSTFKLITMMIALSEGAKNDELVFAENGKYHLFGELINDSESHGWLTFENVFKHSSNIGTAKIALKYGKSKFYKAARAFGFGNKTGIELPGETAGILKKPSEWSRFSLAAMSYGHEVAVSTLQMAMAYSAVANGGLLMQPAIVKEITGADGNRVRVFSPRVIRRVMPNEIANKMKHIFKGVVEDGTGKLAKIPGVSVAGKTGTAQKPLTDRAGYSNRNFIASFVAFYPVEKPEFLIYAMVDEPRPVHFGGKVAAPMVKNIIERIMRLSDAPTLNRQQNDQPMTPDSTWRQTTYIPNFTGRSLEMATKVLGQLGKKYTIEGSGTLVGKQKIIARNGGEPEVVLHLTSPARIDYTKMPNLLGLPTRSAVIELSRRGIHAKIIGNGTVVKQSPERNSKVKTGIQAYLECKSRVSAYLLAN